MNGASAALPHTTHRQAGAPALAPQVLLRSGPLRLLLPQADVAQVQALGNAPEPLGPAGWFAWQDGADLQLLATLSPQLERLAQYPRERFVLVQLVSGDQGLWLGWDEVRMLGNHDLKLQALPKTLCSGPALCTHWALVDDGPAFAVSGPALLARVLGPGATGGAPRP